MKKQFTLISLMILGFTMGIYAQSPVLNDFVIVGLIPGDGNMPQIEMRYQGNPQAYFTIESSVSGVELINGAFTGRQITDLHIFVRSDTEGGGYSGGGGGGWNGTSAGNGGGSYNAGTNQTNTAGSSSGNDQVIITKI